jgi:hypothetical protein
MSKRTLIPLLFLLLAACSPALGGGVDEQFAPAGAPAPEEVMVESEFAAEDRSAFSSGSDTMAQEPAAADRLVIKNANLTLIVDEPGESLDEIAQLAESMGGFVVSSNLFQTVTETGLEVPRASITIRVPSERLAEALSEIEAGAVRVDARNESGQDVTQEYTDLQSRLRNLEDAEAQLRLIMDDARRTEDVISVFNQLTSVREEIEVIKGRIQFFEQSAAFSAISVELIANAAVQPITIGGWQPEGVARSALQALITGLQIIVNILIWLVLFVVPTAIVLLIPVVLAWRGVRSWRARRRARRLAGAPPPPSE